MKNGGTASREALPTWLPSFSGGLPLTPAPESSLDPSGLFSPALQPKVSCYSDWTERYWGEAGRVIPAPLSNVEEERN